MKELKEALCTYPVLRLPDVQKQFYVLSDASREAGAACLAQRCEETGQLYAVAYTAKCWNTTQKNYSMTELELLSILLALQKWRYYLLGTKFTIRIYTDHSANVYLATKKNISHVRLQTWHGRLSEYNAVLEFKRGIDSTLASPDAMTRLIRTPAADTPSAQNPSPPDVDDLEEWGYSADLGKHYDVLFERLHRRGQKVSAYVNGEDYESEHDDPDYDPEELQMLGEVQCDCPTVNIVHESESTHVSDNPSTPTS